LSRLAFLWRFLHLLAVVACRSKTRFTPDGVMSFDLNHEQDLRDLQEQIRRACTITPALMADVIGRACPRLQSQHRSAKARIIRLLESGAFADAMLALLEFELPLWKLRRLIREDDEWHCSISKQLGLPAEFDEMAEASHEGLPLAILSAFVEARRHGVAGGEGTPKSVPQVRPTQAYAICCDNFA
jgi:hypothetical protein